MTKRSTPATKPRPVSKTRTPAMKSQLKSKAKASSGRGAKPAKPPARLAVLLDSIRATPDDEELRLVYADALEESDELDRAELVRAQIAAVRDPSLAARATALQIERDKALAVQAVQWRSDRGLVWHVDARIEDWLAHGAALFETEPITSIGVSDPRHGIVDDDSDHVDLVVDLAKQRWLSYVHAIEIPVYSMIGEPEVVVELLGSPHLRRMARLTVGHPLTAIAAAKHCAMPALRMLYVHCEGSIEGDDVLRAYAERRDALTHLELVGCGTSAAAMRWIVKAGWKLEHLITAGTHYQVDDIGAAGMHALAHAPALASLRELQVETAGLDDAAVRAVAESPHLRSLEKLGFAGNGEITDDGIAMLAESPVLASVQILNLTATGVTARGIAMLPGHVEVIAPHLR